MKQNGIYKQLARYLIPGVASMLSLSLYILADTFFVAMGVGSLGLAGLNIAIPAYSLINGFGLLIGVGSGVVVAVYRGRNEPKAAVQAFNCALALSFGVGVMFTLIGTCFAGSIALLLGASEQSLPYASEYIRTIAAFSLFFLLNNTLVALVRNDNNPRLAMTSMITCSMSNIVLDYIFIIRFGWGMWGAAFATGLAPVIGISILLLHWRRKSGYTLFLEKKLPDFSQTGIILRSGVSSFITELGNGLVIFLFNFTLMRMAGDMAVAAYGIVANISLVLSYVFIGMGQGIQPVLSQYYGADDSESCRKILRFAAGLALTLGVVFFLTGQLFPHQLTALFNSENDPQLASLTVSAIRLYFTCFLFMGLNICCTYYFQSILRAKSASALSLLRGVALVAAGVAVLPQLFGLNGVWMVASAAELITLLICGVFIFADRQRIASPGRSRA